MPHRFYDKIGLAKITVGFVDSLRFGDAGFSDKVALRIPDRLLRINGWIDEILYQEPDAANIFKF
jgi:hypothetical protein